MKGNRILFGMIICSALAIIVAAYLVYIYYMADVTGICQPGTKFDCNSVSQSRYGLMFGLPVSLFGLTFYTVFFLLGLALYKGLELRHIHKSLSRNHTFWLMFLIPLFGTAFSLRLSYIEAMVLKAWCPFCVIQQFIVFIMLILSLSMLRHRHQI